MKIPFVDLATQLRDIRPEIDRAMESVLAETAFVRGRFVEEFEQRFAAECGLRHCISLANGTDAIYIVLKELGIGPGDEVITVANSWISTSEAISQTGATPVFVDIERNSFNIDASLIEDKITERTKAVLPVHLYGQPCEVEAIQEICQRRGLFLVEDCAQAHFARSGGRLVGTFGIAGCFSFYPGKNLGAFGDAGAVVTDDEEFAKRIRMYANHGSLVKHQHEIEGVNSRLDGLQAAVLLVKIEHIHDWNSRRRENARLYSELLKTVDGVVAPPTRAGAEHVFHVYCVRADDRAALQSFLKERGVASGIHYPTPLPFLQAYERLGHLREDFPVAAEYQGKILSLPMFPEMTAEQVRYVCESIQTFYAGKVLS